MFLFEFTYVIDDHDLKVLIGGACVCVLFNFFNLFIYQKKKCAFHVVFLRKKKSERTVKLCLFSLSGQFTLSSSCFVFTSLIFYLSVMEERYISFLQSEKTVLYNLV